MPRKNVIHLWKKYFSEQPMLRSDLCNCMWCGSHKEELTFVTFRIGHLNEGSYAYKSLQKDKSVNAKEGKDRKGKEKKGKILSSIVEKP